MAETRTVAQVDRDTKTLVGDRRRYLKQIEDHLRAVVELRTSYARAGTRIDHLLEERRRLTDSPTPPT